MFQTTFLTVLVVFISIVVLAVGVYLCAALVVACFTGIGKLSAMSDKASVARVAAQRKALGY